MRSLLGGLAATTCLLLCLPVASGVAAVGAPASPSCAEGPVRVGDTTYGTPCADFIVAPAEVETVRGGGGNDTILAAPIAAAIASCPSACFLGVGSQTFEGGPGNDIVFGQRGNDTLLGGEGNDQLFGGIGDDLLRGGPGNDLLAGGFGADFIDGEAGDDYVHGDGTTDKIHDTGSGNDTLSYATGVTPGFEDGDAGTPPGFPPGPEGRGVRLDLGAAAGEFKGNNGSPPFGGGNDEVEGASFETVIGTPFSDYIIGTSAPQAIYGGGGADVIRGGGGVDTIDGGADGDDVGGSGFQLRDPTTVSVGLMTPAGGAYSQLYLAGSDAGDTATATYSSTSVAFTLATGSFDQSPSADAGCEVTEKQATCPLTAPLDSIVMAGMDGNDTLTAAGFPSTVTVVLAGGEGSDSLNGGDASEDVLVDGPGSGADVLNAFGGDDALLHNAGADQLYGGEGNDLFLSNSVCDGNLISGGNGRDNASWARFGEGVGANLASGQAGRPGVGGTPSCGGGLDSLQEIEDLEGSNSRDILYGDAGPNQLLGHKGPDDYSAGPGADTILANSGDPELLDSDPLVDCGDDIDRALIDFPQYGLDVPVNCEVVIEAAPNSFQLLPNFPLPTPPAPTVVPKPVHDRKPPRTKIRARPRAVLTTSKARARAVFRFAANERGSTFRCKLDRKPYRPCVSPRAYMLAPGRHTVRIFAVDPAGNADRTPALLSLRVRRH